MQKNTVTFDKSARMFLLEVFGYAADQEGYIVDAKSKKRVLASDGFEIKVNELAGIMNKKFVRSSLPALIEAADHLK